METIRNLREICQKPMSQADGFQDKLICRRFSIYLTWLLLHTKITAMQATWIFLFLGFVPGFAFMSSSYLLGAILLQFWYIFDGVDGEMARYKKQTSTTGVYFDNIIHYIIHPYIFITIGFGIYKNTLDTAPLVLSIVAAISVMLISIVNDLKGTTFFDSGKENKSLNHDNNQTAASGTFGFAKRTFYFLHKLCTYPTIMNLITVTACLDAFLKTKFLYLLILSYGLLTPLIWFSKLFVNISKKTLD